MTLPGFTELRRLGEGSQGAVLLARHDESGTPVAIKYLPAGAGDEDRARLRHEAQMLARARSPHVARLYRLVEGRDGAALVMEAVDGVSLKVLLERHGALGPEASLTVLKGSLLGLAAAHELGVVHRDYKPANVVVPADGTSKLIDFGIATTAGEETRGAGTPRYMAPEQWGRRPATPATDVYAATCVFVECVSGHPPFDGENQAALRFAHLTKPPPAEAVPEPLRPLVSEGMAKAPEERPESAAAFVDELERIARAEYGADWEARGVRTLAASAVALAALFPLAALLLAPGAGAAGAAGAAGTAGATGAQGLLAGGAAKVAAGAVATAVAAGGAVAVQQIATGGEPPRPTPTVARAAVVPVRQCSVSGPGGPAPAGSPAPVRLPPQVRLPRGAAVHRFGENTYMIGRAGDPCSSIGGVSGGTASIGRAGAGMVSSAFQFSAGTMSGTVCRYFPDSADAARIRRNLPDCASDIDDRRDLPTGAPGVLAMTAPIPDELREGVPASPYVAITLALMEEGDPAAAAISCTMPWTQAAVCTAALTYHFVRAMERGGITTADLGRVARDIEAAVTASRR
ncbi:serine/threonine-protein kinase [Spirillospora sp. CA-255316]